MGRLIIEPHYLGNLEYYTALTESENWVFEIDQHFTKQTFKNRCCILTTQGVQSLTVPVQFDQRTPLREVLIDYSQSWKRDHWGAFYSAYGKAPFFEYFGSEFRKILDGGHKFLLDLNMEMMTLCLKILQIDMPFSFTSNYAKTPDNGFVDRREQLLPKIPFDKREVYHPLQYPQLFGNEFVPNLSIIDLLMCEGTQAKDYLG